MLSKKDNRNMKIVVGLAIIYIWFIFVGLPAITGSTIELLLAFSIIPTFLTILWFDLVFYKDDKEKEEQ